MPSKWKKYQLSWITNNPDYQYYLWTDEENRKFLEDFYPWFLNTYDKLSEPIMRADAMRPFYLYHFGGIYVDLDYECYKSFDGVLDYHNRLDNKVLLARQMVGDRASNFLMISEAGHPFWRKVIEKIQNRIGRKWWHTRMLYVWYTTGPNVINDTYLEYSKNNTDIVLLSNKEFNSTNSIDAVVYGKHHESQSWGDSNSTIVLGAIDSLRKMKDYSSSSSD